MKTYTPTQLREDIYNILDEVTTTGQPIKIRTKKTTLTLVPQETQELARFSKLKKRSVVVGPSEDLVHMDWSRYWKPGRF